MSYDSDEKQLVMELKQRFPDQIQAIDAKELHYVLLGLDPDFPEQIESIMHFRRTRIEYWRRFHQVPSHQWEWTWRSSIWKLPFMTIRFVTPPGSRSGKTNTPTKLRTSNTRKLALWCRGERRDIPKPCLRFDACKNSILSVFMNVFLQAGDTSTSVNG